MHESDSNKAVFLDRDGTIVHDRGYLENPEGIELMPHAGEALTKLKQHGYLLVLVTNQSGVGRGYFREDAVESQHRRLRQLLHSEGVELDLIRFCPHAPDAACDCRKPQAGLILEAAETLGVDLHRSFMVGDKLSDIEAGRRAGCRTVLIDGTSDLPDYVAKNMRDAADWIVSQ